MRSATQSPTTRRLVVYLTGIAIGFVLLGWLSSRRNQEAAERARQEAEARASEDAGSPQPPPPAAP